VISGFRHAVDENCVLLGHYAASSGNFLPTFRDNLSVQSPKIRTRRPAVPVRTVCTLSSEQRGPASSVPSPSDAHRHHSLLAGPDTFPHPFPYVSIFLRLPSISLLSTFHLLLPSLPSFLFFHCLPIPSPASYSPLSFVSRCLTQVTCPPFLH
jgi:hypothetical protein